MSTEVEVDGCDKLPEILERSRFQATRELRAVFSGSHNGQAPSSSTQGNTVRKQRGDVVLVLQS